MNLRKDTIYLLTSCNTEERIAQNIYIHNSNRNYKKLTTTAILIKKTDRHGLSWNLCLSVFAGDQEVDCLISILLRF